MAECFQWQKRCVARKNELRIGSQLAGPFATCLVSSKGWAAVAERITVEVAVGLAVDVETADAVSVATSRVCRPTRNDRVQGGMD